MLNAPNSAYKWMLYNGDYEECGWFGVVPSQKPGTYHFRGAYFWDKEGFLTTLDANDNRFEVAQYCDTRKSMLKELGAGWKATLFVAKNHHSEFSTNVVVIETVVLCKDYVLKFGFVEGVDEDDHYFVSIQYKQEKIRHCFVQSHGYAVMLRGFIECSLLELECQLQQ